MESISEILGRLAIVPVVKLDKAEDSGSACSKAGARYSEILITHLIRAQQIVR